MIAHLLAFKAIAAFSLLVGASSHLPIFHWTSTEHWSSDVEVPDIIATTNSSVYTIKLEHHTPFKGAEEFCNFIGKVDGYQDSEVTVTGGCPDGTRMEIMFLSDIHEFEDEFYLVVNGNTSVINITETYGESDSEMLNSGSLTVPPEFQNNVTEIDKRQTLGGCYRLYIQLAHDLSLWYASGYDSNLINNYISSVLTVAQGLYHHASLGRVTLDFYVSNQYEYINRVLEADERSIQELLRLANIGSFFHHYALFTYDFNQNDDPVGIAFVGSACSFQNYRISIHEIVESTALGGYIFAHELGHALGLEHTTGSCNGIMNPFLPPLGTVWSSCGRNDFQAYLRGSGQCLLQNRC